MFLRAKNKQFLAELLEQIKAIEPSKRPQKDITTIVLSKRLILSKWDFFFYYFPAIMFLAMGLFFVVASFMVWNKDGQIRFEKLVDFIFVPLPFIVAAIIMFVIRIRRLRLIELNILLNYDVFDRITSELALENGWDYVPQYQNYFQATTGDNWMSKEKITILNTGNRILINSICDPDQRSLSSFGRNTQNILKIKKKFKEQPI